MPVAIRNSTQRFAASCSLVQDGPLVNTCAPSGQWLDAVQTSANAPQAAGSFGVLGSVTPTNVTESNAADNSALVNIQVH
jgi:hypothetical protein